jgi:hypothetical protein
MLRPIMLRGFTALIATAALAGAARDAPSWTETLSARVLSAGASVQLPPHLSGVLGLANNGRGIAVRQLVARDGHTVRTFNVGTDAPHRVVLIVVDEAQQSSVAYLLTHSGQLRKAVAYHTGEEPRELSAAEARAGLDTELRFWSLQAAAGAPRRQ